jgi:ATP-dependent helicase/nuclease subunit B
MNDIRCRMEAGESGMLLIVPEQYSHAAERLLCAFCGDKLSLHAETLSFTRLCNTVFSEAGGASGRILDSGGRVLVMHRALESVAPSLKVFGVKKLRTEFLNRLLEAVMEFKSLNISPKTLVSIAERAGSPLADKLHDLALIYDAYTSLLSIHGGDAAERLTLLADLIGESSVGNSGHIYFDGFNDFTAQELRVIEELLRKSTEITVCLTCDTMSLNEGERSPALAISGESEVFEIPRRTFEQLRKLAGILSTEIRITTMESAEAVEKSPELAFLEEHLFKEVTTEFPGVSSDITIYAGKSGYEECEYAAYTVCRLVREGYRWRDIAVMARDWTTYGANCESVFERYGIPYFSSGKADILSKSPAALIEAALDIAATGWEYNNAFRYLKTGLLDISADECAELENYVLKWKIRGTLWTKEWILHPSGFGGGKVDDELLQKINKLRQKVAEPIMRLRDGVKGTTEIALKLQALYDFLEFIKLPERLAERAEELDRRGEMRLADEYVQLWEVIKNAMEQMYTILGSTELSALEFRKLFTLVLSQYDVGVIPVALDRTALGGMAMSRRRDVKCLILLGATDENMPSLGKSNGALSDSERVEMGKLGMDIPAGMEERLCREMNILYSTITMPSHKLVVVYPTSAGQRPSFLVKRLKTMYKISDITLDMDKHKAERVGFLPLPHTARKSFVLVAPRRKLSGEAAKRLYGGKVSLSATRADRFYSCQYKHFLQSGLKLEPRVPAEFDASAAGIFMHYVLEGVSREIRASVGFKGADELMCRELTSLYINKYVQEVLLDFDSKSARFIYLFKRLEEDVKRVVLDMLDELKNSEFEPLDFELNLADISDTLRGVVDRVDGFSHKDKLYLRVIDYKTRRKAHTFSLSDVIYGRSMQMLIYLFALQKYGSTRYGKHIEPAGVLYVPARDVILSTARNIPEALLEKMRTDEMRRSGIILEDSLVLEAMEAGDVKRYLPVKTSKEGEYIGDSLVNANQVEMMSKYVHHLLASAGDIILDGGIECRPYYKNDRDNACQYCEFHTVCGFDEELGDKRRYVRKLKPDEIWKAIEAIV